MHRLLQREDGSVRCSACMLCAQVCPAGCITVEVSPEEGERRPVRFAIDLGRCLFCGRCVEACPDDAIRMDSGRWAEPAERREALVIEMDALLANSPAGVSPLSRAL